MLFVTKKRKRKKNEKHYSKAIIIAMAVLACLVCLLFIIKPVRSADVAFATKITVNLNSDETKSVQITDKDDMAQLKELCYGKAYRFRSTPKCSFGAVELVFEDSKHKVVLYPAYDGCCTMRLGDKGYYYDITSDDRDAIESLLAKYDIAIPSV